MKRNRTAAPFHPLWSFPLVLCMVLPCSAGTRTQVLSNGKAALSLSVALWFLWSTLFLCWDRTQGPYATPSGLNWTQGVSLALGCGQCPEDTQDFPLGYQALPPGLSPRALGSPLLLSQPPWTLLETALTPQWRGQLWGVLPRPLRGWLG